MLKFGYIFPENLRAVKSNDIAQATKVLEEANELYQAVLMAEGRKRVLEEALDVVHAVEGVIRRYKTQEVDLAVKEVYLKNKQRGDYL